MNQSFQNICKCALQILSILFVGKGFDRMPMKANEWSIKLNVFLFARNVSIAITLFWGTDSKSVLIFL